MTWPAAMASLIDEVTAACDHLSKHPIELYDTQREDIRVKLEKADAAAANKVSISLPSSVVVASSPPTPLPATISPGGLSGHLHLF